MQTSGAPPDKAEAGPPHQADRLPNSYRHHSDTSSSTVTREAVLTTPQPRKAIANDPTKRD